MASLKSSLKYQFSNSSPWGVTAFYEGYLLEFSGLASKRRIRKEKLESFLPFLKNQPEPTDQKIIKSVDIYALFSPSAKKAWNKACLTSLKHKRPMAMEDLFLSLLASPSVKKLFEKLKINTSAAETFLINYLKLSSQPETENIKKVPFEAFSQAMALHNRKIGSLMLLGGLLHLAPQDNVLQAIFSNINLTLDKLEILSVWILNLQYEFPEGSSSSHTTYCCLQAQNLENHFGYFFEFPAIESAVKFSQNYYKDLRGQKALQYLVKAGALAKAAGTMRVSEKFVQLAASR